MSICCGHCGAELKKDNFVVLDFAYTLSHIYCSNLASNLVLSVGVLEDIAAKYPALNVKKLLD